MFSARPKGTRLMLNHTNIRKLYRLLNLMQTQNGQLLRSQLQGPTCKSTTTHFNFDMETIYSDHGSCGSAGCAIGLMYWAGMIPDTLDETVEQCLGIDQDTLDRIFYGKNRSDGERSYYYGQNGYLSHVTPDQVARELEKLLGAQGLEAEGETNA